MNKLGERFSDYARLLTCVRSSYFHFTQRLGEGSLYHLMSGAGSASAEQVTELYDAFLDAYSEWQAKPQAQSHAALGAAVQALRAADPEFAFEMPASPQDDGNGSEG